MDPGAAGLEILADPDGAGGGVDGTATRSFSSVAASRVTSRAAAASNDIPYLPTSSLKKLPAYPSWKFLARSSGPIATTS